MSFFHTQNMITGTQTSKTPQVASNWFVKKFYMYQSRMSLPLWSSRKSTQRARQCVFGGWVGGWMGGWVVIFYPLRFSLFSGMFTSIMWLFQIWCQNLSTAFRSKVMIDLSLKFGKNKADIIGENWSEKIVTKNTMDWWRFFSHIKNMIVHSKTSKIHNLQKWYQNGSKPII